MAKKSPHFSSDDARPVKGMLINRPAPAHAGFCGNDNCEHRNHKQMRGAQAAADKKKGVKVIA